MMKTTKRIISLLLCLAMILSMGLVPAFADDTNYNLLINPDFELGSGTPGQTTSTLDGWEIDNGGRMVNNPYSGTYGFYLNTAGSPYIQQTVEIPETNSYKLTAWLAGNGIISIAYEGGEVIESKTHSGGSYSQVVFENIALEAGDKVTIKIVPNGGWINGDEFVFCSAAAYDMVFVSEVITLIDAIGEVNSDSKSAIKAARDAYEALSSEARAKVTNYSVLVKAERDFASLKSAEVMALIDALGEITEESIEAVNAARNEYEKLTPEQKEQVLNLPVLEAAEAKLKELGIYVEQKLTPIMGWSSWNNYHVAISEELFVSQIDAMVELGLVDAGYEYFNIDDGFQMGRDPETDLVLSNTKFPNGVAYIAEYAHKNGMKAGIYSDCGYNTCASVSDGQGTSPDWYTGEPGNGWGLGVGLYDHWYEDLYQYFITWDFDFIKIDWCGGRDFKPQALDQQTEYTRIGKYIDQIELEKGEDLIYNVCCWKFPGEWVVDVADSWRVSGDISANFNSVLQQLDACAQLAEYHGPGHVNDMDMLQVGRGMTLEEDKSHFGMWCMLSVPLVLGHDVTTTTDETLEIITNKELIAINQDPAVIMAEPVKTEAGVQTWVKPLGSEDSGEKAIALLNRNAYSTSATVTWSEVGFNGDVQVRDLWAHEDLTVGDSYTVTLPAHGCAILKVTGDTSASISSIKSIVVDGADVDLDSAMDWVDVTQGEEMENAYIVDQANETSATIKAVSTTRIAYVEVEGENAVITATLNGKQTVGEVEEYGVYVLEYTGELGGGDLKVTVDGGKITAIVVTEDSEFVSAVSKLVVSNTTGGSDFITPRPETEVLDAVAYVGGGMKSTDAGLLVDYVTAEGAEISLNAENFPVQSNLGDYYEVYLPATSELTRAIVVYGVRYGKATVTVENGDQVETFQVHDLDGTGNAQELSVWYTASEDVKVTITLDSIFSGDAELMMIATDLLAGGDILTRPEVEQQDNLIMGTAYAESADSNTKIAVELFTKDGTSLGTEYVPFTGNGIQDVTMELPEGITEGYFTVALNNGTANTTEGYKFAFPIVDENVPVELPLIGNLLAQKLVEEGAILIDTRSAEEYEAGHIDGAINVEYTDILTYAAEKLTDKDAAIVVYCSAGKRSTQAQMALTGMGYTNVHNIGAMDNWYIVPSIDLAGNSKGMKLGETMAILFEANPYETGLELYYALGKDAAFEDAEPVPADHFITLEGDGWVKAYLLWNGEIVAETADKMPLLENVEIPEWDVDVYLSDIEWLTNDSFWKPANRDKSTDGNPLAIAGNSFDKGIGAHAWSIIEINIPAGMNRFVAVAGMDDEVKAQIEKGYKVQYAVFVDDVLLEESLELPIGYYHVFDVEFPVGSGELRLEIYNTGDGTNYDHSDWAVAGFIAASQEEIDAAAAEKVMNKIAALGEITSLEQESAVVAAREGYEALTEEQKALVSEESVATLEAAEAAIELLKNPPFVNPFTDVKEGDWYYDSVMWAVQNGITSGATETTFNYDGLSERCQVVTFLWRAAGEPEPETTENPFTDVNEGHYFYKAVLWAYEKGITQGISDTEFGPFAKCTRGQVVTFLHRVEGTPESSFVNTFEDVNEGHYFYDAVLWAAENGITVGRTDTTFDPEGQCKRSEIVTFLYRCMAE